MGRLMPPGAFSRPKPKFWDGAAWRDERRFNIDHRVGRRRTDVWFPYNPAFVVQALGQQDADPHPAADTRHYGPRSPVAGRRYSFDA